MLARKARQCCAPLRSLVLGWGPAPSAALQSNSLLDAMTGQASAPLPLHSSRGTPLPGQAGSHSRAQCCPHGAHLSSCPHGAPQLGSSRLPGGNALEPHSQRGPAHSLLPWAALGGVRGAKAAAAQQQGKMSKQQLLRQKRRGPADGPVVEQPGIVHVASTKNNTIITLTDEAGNTKAWSSAGEAGFKGARKATSYAAEAAAGKLAVAAMRLGFRTVRLRVRGLGRGKQASIKTLTRTGLVITQIDECTPLPHNGCRPPAKRRI